MKTRNFRAKLFESVDALPLGVFRLLFGLLLALEFFVISRATFPADYIKPQFHFTYPVFDLIGLKALPERYLWWLFYALQVSTVGIALGLLTRLSFIVFTFAFGYFFFLESTVYTNHYYLIFLLSFLLCFGHSGCIFSVDSVVSKRARTERVDYWEFYLLRFQIWTVFLFGALAKMNADWLIRGAPLYLNFIRNFSFLGHPFHEKWLALLLSWGGMLSDLALGLLLMMNRWPRLTFLWLCLFNGMNVYFFGRGIKTFPYLMIASYILFLPSTTARRLIASVKSGALLNKRGAAL